MPSLVGSTREVNNNFAFTNYDLYKPDYHAQKDMNDLNQEEISNSKSDEDKKIIYENILINNEELVNQSPTKKSYSIAKIICLISAVLGLASGTLFAGFIVATVGLGVIISVIPGSGAALTIPFIVCLAMTILFSTAMGLNICAAVLFFEPKRVI